MGAAMGAGGKMAVVLWLVLLLAIAAVAATGLSANPDDDLIRNTVRLSLLYYAPAVSLMVVLHPGDWAALSPRGRLARWCWTLAWAAYLIQVGLAFHYAHHWSHAHAVEVTRQRSGVGEGIYVSHLFTLLWTADVLAWWLRPGWYATRNPWFGRLLHGFMLFVIFNGTIVFEEGLIRWAGVVLFIGLGGLWMWSRGRGSLVVAKQAP
jgi:hypothetical protein